jgi:hypothetical protein
VTLMPMAGATLAVVTGRPVDAGSTISSGDVLTEVNGRPVLLAQSPFPFYRDMGFGDLGPDVRVLQSMLAARGYDAGIDSQFGAATAMAVKNWYEDNGYRPLVRARSISASSAVGSDGIGDVTQDAPTPAPPPGVDTKPIEDAYVPVAEIVGILPSSARVIRGVGVGTRVAVSGAPDFVIGSADTVVTVTASASELGDVAEGDVATISFAGTEVEGAVGEISRPSTDGGGSGSGGVASPAAPSEGSNQATVTFTITPKTPLPSSTGQARVVVTKNVVSHEALLVPVLAVVDRGGDSVVVTKRGSDGTLVEVQVAVLGTLQGEAAVEPVTEGSLKVGDEVRVG